MTTHLNPDHSVFEAEGVKVFYNGFLALLDVHIKIPAQKNHRLYRAVRLREKYPLALL